MLVSSPALLLCYFQSSLVLLYVNVRAPSFCCPSYFPSCSMFCEMFRHLPVCSVIHDKVLVIHGGLFHREGITLDDIDQVKPPRPIRNDCCTDVGVAL